MGSFSTAMIIGVCLAVVAVVTIVVCTVYKGKKKSSNSECDGCPHANECQSFNEENKNKRR